METAQLFFPARTSRNAEKTVNRVQRCLAALLHNGQIVGDRTPMARVRGGSLVVASLPETDALAERFGNKWVREVLRELATVGVGRPEVTHLGTDPESRA